MTKHSKAIRHMIAIVIALVLIVVSTPMQASAAGKTAKVPAKVTVTSVKSVACNKVTIKWHSAGKKNTTGYRIYYRQHTKAGWSKWTLLKTVSKTKTSWTHVSSKKYPVKANTKYQYAVRGYNKNTKAKGAYKAKTVVTRKHAWKVSSTVKATCTKDGRQVSKCRLCGAASTKKLTRLGHNYKNGKCTRCGAVKAHTHKWSVTKEATCTGKGTRTCSVCGATESISALGHDWHEETYGHLAPLCNECGYQASSTDDYYSHAFATGHNGYNCGSVVDGYHNVCSRCGAVQE